MKRIYRSDQLPLALKSTELDFLTLLEAGYRPPIAFRSWDHLEAWCASQPELELHPVGRRKPHNVRHLIGKVGVPGHGGGHFYGQLWVRAGYGDYRKAVLALLRAGERFNGAVRTHDVDHMVSSTWLARHWGRDAVVNVALSEKGINRRIGGLIESNLPSPAPDADMVQVNAISLAKLLYDNDDDSRDVTQILREAFSRFLPDPATDALLTAIARELVPDFRLRPSGQG